MHRADKTCHFQEKTNKQKNPWSCHFNDTQLSDTSPTSGEKRLNSLIQLGRVERGATTRKGPITFFSTIMAMWAMHWMVFPSPISSARMPLMPFSHSIWQWKGKNTLLLHTEPCLTLNHVWHWTMFDTEWLLLLETDGTSSNEHWRQQESPQTSTKIIFSLQKLYGYFSVVNLVTDSFTVWWRK